MKHHIVVFLSVKTARCIESTKVDSDQSVPDRLETSILKDATPNGNETSKFFLFGDSRMRQLLRNAHGHYHNRVQSSVDFLKYVLRLNLLEKLKSALPPRSHLKSGQEGIFTR